MTRILPATHATIAATVTVFRAGGLVAFPTETVYGLGADATNDLAVARIFEAKSRPDFNPLIVHVADRAMAEEIVEFTDVAQTLADRFWPGALTLVLPRRADSAVSRLVSAGLGTVAVRAPDHPIAQKLLAAADCPIAAPSANRSGKISPTAAEHVRVSLGDAVDVILDGGPCRIGLESTVVDASGDVPVLLRPGGVAVVELNAAVG